MSVRFLLVLACAAAWSASACQEQRSVELPPGPIRLADLLANAQIRGPITAVAPATALRELADAPRELLLNEDFEAFDFAAARWPSGAGEITDKAEGGHALRLQHLGWGSGYGWVVPAEPNAHYVFERSVRTDAPLDADFTVIEVTQGGVPGPRGLFDQSKEKAGRKHELKAHTPGPVTTDGGWQRSGLSLFTAQRTKALAVFLRPTARQQTQQFRWGNKPATNATMDVRFDDLVLERVRPTAEQSVALVKAQSLAPGADPVLGIHKRGQFPPLGDVEVAYSDRDDNFSHRNALYAPPPGSMSFALPVRPGAELFFSVCLSRQSSPGAAAEFEVTVHDGDRDVSLWTHSVRAEGDDWGWHDVRLPLEQFEGRTVDLVLSTRAIDGESHPMWGNPVVDTPETARPRHVILIGVDTLRADRLSCYGYRRATSPRIDELAADGIRFENVASNSNWTCPSFASIFTGLVPSRHGVFGFGPVTPIPAGFDTLAERFRARGWSTHAIAFKPALYDGAFDQGFDVSFNVPRRNVKAQDNLQEALQWLERHAARRSFLFLHFNDPHQPFTQPAPFDSKFSVSPRKAGIRKRPNAKSKNEKHRDIWRAMYDGEVAYVDDRIGAFLDALKEKKLYDDAVIAFVSDHGEQLWERDDFGHGQGMLHDEVVRVPLIVKPAAGAHAPGAVVQTQVRGFDVMPTILELAGLPADAELDAESLVPLFDASDAEAPDRLAVIETSGSQIAVRNQHWKYLRGRLGRRGGARRNAVTEQLYELTADPGEKSDVAAQHPDTLTTMRRQSLDYLLRHRPGTYLVAVGNGSTRRDLVVQGVAQAKTLFGLPVRPSTAGEGTARFAGRTTGTVVLVADIIPEGPVKVSEVSETPLEPKRYEAGDLQALIDAPRDGQSLRLQVFEGPPRVAESRALGAVDMRQLDALRQLGYIGDKPGGH